MTDETVSVSDDLETTVKLGILMKDVFPSPEDMDKLPNVILSLVRVTSGLVATTNMTKQEAMEFLEAAFDQAYDIESAAVEELLKEE